MYNLIETKDQLKEFEYYGYKEAFIEIIPFNNNIHPCENFICAFYIKPLSINKGFIISINHSEMLSLNLDDVINVLNNIDKIYVRDKKEFLHYVVFNNIIDLTLNKYYDVEYTPTHLWFYKKYPNKKDTNRIIPIVKHFEYCEKIYDDLKLNINEPINEFYNNKTSVVFNAIERSGLRIDRKQFQQNFHDVDSDFVYTQYNFKTLTTRPSNKFNGVNYSALNKENGSRQCFIPRNDLLFEIDIGAYHPTLLANMVGYNFGEDDIHKEFAKLYGVDYNKAKELTFKQIYGGIFKQYQDLEFFKLVINLTNNIWEEFNNSGHIVAPISNYYFRKDKLNNMNPQKLLNYILQSLETSQNILILWDIFKILRGKKTKLILYTFDSFLFDFSLEETEIINNIKQIFKKYKLRIKINYGTNYDFRR
jgi:hypothetical protein